MFPIYVSYEEAQRLMPVFAYFAEHGEWAEVRRDARSILHKLRAVRPGQYEPLGGKQVFLTEGQHAFFEDVKAEVDS